MGLGKGVDPIRAGVKASIPKGKGKGFDHLGLEHGREGERGREREREGERERGRKRERERQTEKHT